MADSTTADRFHARLDQAKLRLVRWLGHSLATREGEENPKLDQVSRGNNVATREGEETPRLDQVSRGNNIETREGEDTPKLDQVSRGNNTSIPGEQVSRGNKYPGGTT